MNDQRFDAALRESYRSFSELDFQQAAAFMEAVIESLYGLWLRDGDRALDLGACVARHSLPMARAVGESGVVDAFEAAPDTARELQRRLQRDPAGQRVRLHQFALSNANDEGGFHFAPNAPGLSGLKRRPRALANQEVQTLTVPIRRLDECLPEDSRPLRFIKSDLEGGDLHALQGAGDLLRQQRPLIVLEAAIGAASEMYDFAAGEFFDFFAGQSYVLTDILGMPLPEALWREPHPWYLVATPRELEGEIARVHATALAHVMLTTDLWPVARK